MGSLFEALERLIHGAPSGGARDVGVMISKDEPALFQLRSRDPPLPDSLRYDRIPATKRSEIGSVELRSTPKEAVGCARDERPRLACRVRVTVASLWPSLAQSRLTACGLTTSGSCAWRTSGVRSIFDVGEIRLNDSNL